MIHLTIIDYIRPHAHFKEFFFSPTLAKTFILS